jgi:hypothetical protein
MKSKILHFYNTVSCASKLIPVPVDPYLIVLLDPDMVPDSDPYCFFKDSKKFITKTKTIPIDDLLPTYLTTYFCFSGQRKWPGGSVSCRIHVKLLQGSGSVIQLYGPSDLDPNKYSRIRNTLHTMYGRYTQV